MLFGTMIESSPWAKVVYSSPSEATTPSSWPATPPACSRTRSPTRNGRAEISTSPAIRLPSVCCAARPKTTAVNAPPTASVSRLQAGDAQRDEHATRRTTSRIRKPTVPAVAGSIRRNSARAASSARGRARARQPRTTQRDRRRRSAPACRVAPNSASRSRRRRSRRRAAARARAARAGRASRPAGRAVSARASREAVHCAVCEHPHQRRAWTLAVSGAAHRRRYPPAPYTRSAVRDAPTSEQRLLAATGGADSGSRRDSAALAPAHRAPRRAIDGRAGARPSAPCRAPAGRPRAAAPRPGPSPPAQVGAAPVELLVELHQVGPLRRSQSKNISRISPRRYSADAADPRRAGLLAQRPRSPRPARARR